MKRICHGNNIQGGGTKGHVNLVEKAIFMAWSSTCTHLNFNKLTTIFMCENRLTELKKNGRELNFL
jgi:hypothetical protein